MNAAPSPKHLFTDDALDLLPVASSKRSNVLVLGKVCPLSSQAMAVGAHVWKRKTAADRIPGRFVSDVSQLQSKAPL